MSGQIVVAIPRANKQSRFSRAKCDSLHGAAFSFVRCRGGTEVRVNIFHVVGNRGACQKCRANQNDRKRITVP